MKNLSVLLLILFFSLKLQADFIRGGEVRVTHISQFDYEISIIGLIGQQAIPISDSTSIKIFERNSTNLMATLSLPLVEVDTLSSIAIACNSNFSFWRFIYSDTVTLPQNLYNDPGGYLVIWESCCRSSSIVNINNSNMTGHTFMTLIPPVVVNSGTPTVFQNSSPVLKNPKPGYVIGNKLYLRDFGGYDPDGDSIDFVLYTPFDNTGGNILTGTTSTLTSPYSDPRTQITNVNWKPGYNEDDQIHGNTLPNPSPNRLKINNSTGEVTVTPENMVGVYSFGIWCREYRNGILIGSTFKESSIFVLNSALPNYLNAKPEILMPQNQALANWNGDTLVFTGAPICIPINITDVDTASIIEMGFESAVYDDMDLFFTKTIDTIYNGDTFNTSLCFQPIVFDSSSSRFDILAYNQSCYSTEIDTLSFYIKFEGYSNAGVGGNYVETIGSSSNIDLFSLIGPSFNFNGTWINPENSIYFDPNGIFVGSQISTPQTFNFIYIDQQPNYPADSSFVSIEFRMPSYLEKDFVSEVKVYPNPANNVITITGVNQNSEFRIYNVQGEEVLSQMISRDKNQLSIEHLRVGIYFYNFSGTENIKGKLIIQH